MSHKTLKDYRLNQLSTAMVCRDAELSVGAEIVLPYDSIFHVELIAVWETYGWITPLANTVPKIKVKLTNRGFRDIVLLRL